MQKIGISRRIFVLGLGAQKAGTSWLHDYLARRVDCEFGPLKECHVFDALFLEELNHFNFRRDPSLFRQPRRVIRYLLSNGGFPVKEALRKKLRSSPAAYTQHFQALVSQSCFIQVTGDITPEYAALSSERLSEIAFLIQSAGFFVRPIFLLRDPVERCISSLKMHRGRASSRKIYGLSDGDSIEKIISHHGFSGQTEMLTRYDWTLKQLEAVFDSDQYYVGFYEELFRDEEIRRICSYLEIPYQAADFTKRVNAGAESSDEVPESLRSELAHHYRSVYVDVFERFGEERVRNLWTSCRFIR